MKLDKRVVRDRQYGLFGIQRNGKGCTSEFKGEKNHVYYINIMKTVFLGEIALKVFGGSSKN